MSPQHFAGQWHIFANRVASDSFTFLKTKSSTISHIEYKQLITHLNNVTWSTYSITSAPIIRNKNTMLITIAKQFFPQYNVNNNSKAITPAIIDDANLLNPQKIINAPIKALPKYPAGKVTQSTPPDISVAPPSSGSSCMDMTLPPVHTAVIAWPSSWKATVTILKG